MTRELILIFKLRENYGENLLMRRIQALYGIALVTHNHPLRVANRKLIYKFIGSSWWSWLIIIIMALIWPPVS